MTQHQSVIINITGRMGSSSVECADKAVGMMVGMVGGGLMKVWPIKHTDGRELVRERE